MSQRWMARSACGQFTTGTSTYRENDLLNLELKYKGNGEVEGLIQALRECQAADEEKVCALDCLDDLATDMASFRDVIEQYKDVTAAMVSLIEETEADLKMLREIVGEA